MDSSIFEPLTPYFFAGVDLGAGVNDILALLHIDELDTAWDDDGVVMWGIARIDSDNPDSFLFSPRSGGGPPAVDANGAPRPDAEVWEWHDLSVRFRLTVARQPTAILPSASITDTNLQTLLQSFGPSTGTAPSDYAGTQFRLELLLSLVTITLGDLRGAKLEANGLLVEDPDHPRVKLKLPRILLIVEQGSTGPNTPFSVRVGSFGATGLDGQSREIASLIEMDPPYALVGPNNVFGFGIRSMILDLDDSQTPPQLLDNFGIGEDWQGVYIPEARIFIAPSGMSGFAVSAGVRELLIGVADTPGVWGDFIVDVINQGDALRVFPRFYDALREQLSFELESTDVATKLDHYRVRNVPDEASMIIDVMSGAAPYTIIGLFGRDANAAVPSNADFADASQSPIDLSVSQHHNIFAVRQQIAIRVTTRNPAQSRILIIESEPAAALSSSPAIQKALLGAAPPVAHRIFLENEDREQFVLGFEPVAGLTVSIDGTPASLENGKVMVSIPRGGGSHAFTYEWAISAREPHRLQCYFEHDKPASNTSGGIVMKDSPGPSGGDIASSTSLTGFLAQLPATVNVRVDGFASFESTTNQTSDEALSQRRADAFADVLRQSIAGRVLPVHANGHHTHPRASTSGEENAQVTTGDADLDLSGHANAEAHSPGTTAVLSKHWRAMASFTAPGVTLNGNGTITRAAPVPAPARQPLDMPPAPSATRPDFLREIGATVRILQGEFVAFEIRGKVDFHTAAESGLEEFRGTPTPGIEIPTPPVPARTNPEDGVVDFRLNISLDDTTNVWTERLSVAAGAGDKNGLWSLGSVPTESTHQRPPSTDVGRDLLGLYFAIAPLAASAARPNPDAGDIVALTTAVAAPLLVAALDIAHVEQFTLYGLEIAFKHHGAFEDGKLAVLFDVESAIWLNLKLTDDFRIITCRPDLPVRIRYKSVGFTINAGFDGTGPFVPVFDASKGFTIDLADSGSLKVLPDLPGGLGDIIQLLGARIARTNPLNLEVELALGVDLGVFKMDRFGFRLPIDPLGRPTLTSLGVTIDITNTIVGTGRLSINDTGFMGQVDVSLPSVKLRIAAGLGIANLEDAATGRTATGVYLSLRIELPVGIPLGGSGLGIFGFLGIFAMHFHRLEPATGNDKALRWMRDVVRGDPTNIVGWGPKLDAWAFGVGIMLGTMEGAYVVRLTGLLAVELPGPRLLFFLMASLINMEPPGNVASESGTLLAVLDLDFGAGTITLGIQVDYAIDPILRIMIPVEGFFDTHAPENFYVDIGSIARPATATVLKVFRATAYLMVHGNGIPDFPLGALSGFSIAAGFHVSLEWGQKEINLYLEVAAGFDAGIGFAPFFIAGRVYLRGALHLFIVSVEARGELRAESDTVDTWLFGEVCGSVDCFFFEVEGCVSFELGTKPGTPHAPALTRGLALQSRSPALVRGTGIGPGIDNVLAHGTVDGSVPSDTDEDGNEVDVYVPIDAISLVQMEVAPELASGFTIADTLVGALPGGNGGWRKRGDIFVRYRLSSVQLQVMGGGPITTAGERPNTWRSVPISSNGDAPPIALAMLDWSPNATPKAFEAGEGLDDSVGGTYGDLCDPIAPPASVYWSFEREPVGESPAGWELDGEVWPDPVGSRRSSEVRVGLRVIETWRSEGMLNAFRSVVPARIVAGPVLCPPRRPRPRPLDTVGVRPDLFERPINIPAPIEEPGRASVIDVIRGETELLVERVTPIRPLEPFRIDIAHKLLSDLVTLERPVNDPRGLGIRVFDASREAPGTTTPGTASPGHGVAVPPTGRPTTMTHIPIVFSPTIESSRGCVGRVLIAPFEHEGADRAPEDLAKIVAEIFAKKYEKELADVIRFEGGPFHSFRMLALLRSKMAVSRLYGAVAFDEEGNEFAVEIGLESISALAGLPERWRTTTGPWLTETWLGYHMLQATAGRGDWKVYVVEFKLEKPASAIEFGIRPLALAFKNFGLTYPAYLVATMEGLTTAEVDRAADDAQDAADTIQGLEGVLLHDPALRALLIPGRRYDVVVSYDAQVGAMKEGSMEVLRDWETDSQTRTFFTDANPPKKLEPWILCEFPAPTERYHFYDDPVIVVFGTDDVTQLFAAYGRDLRGVVRDASFRPPPADPVRDDTIKWFAGAAMQKIGGVIFSPWEQTVRRKLMDKPCGQFNPDAPRHERAVLDFHMEPATEYVFDVEAPRASDGIVPPNTDTIIEPLFRMGFGTSRYASRAALAADVRQAYIGQRPLSVSTPLEALAEACTDAAFDAALIASGLGVTERVDEPRITIMWVEGTPPRAAMILIETPEPLWRMRLEPEAVRDADGRVIRWELETRQWLGVEEIVPIGGGTLGLHAIADLPFVRSKSGVRTETALTIPEMRDRYLLPEMLPPPLPPVAVGSLARRFVHDTSGFRTLVMLEPSARGRTVSLSLVRALNPLIDVDTVDDPLPLLDVFVEKAPWEVSA